MKLTNYTFYDKAQVSKRILAAIILENNKNIDTILDELSDAIKENHRLKQVIGKLEELI